MDLAKWLNKDPTVAAGRLPLLDGEDRKMRGFHHELTGRLLCPIEHDWSDPEYVNDCQNVRCGRTKPVLGFSNAYEIMSLILTQVSSSIACTKVGEVIQTMSKTDSFAMDIWSRYSLPLVLAIPATQSSTDVPTDLHIAIFITWGRRQH